MLAPRCGLSLVLVASLLPAQAILRVGPGQTFTALQPAIDAAQPGDRILVDTGYYQGPFRVARGVRIACASGTVLGAGIRFDLIPARESATLSGAMVTASTSGLRGLSAVQVTGCAGVVSLQDCRLTTMGVWVQGSGSTLWTVYNYTDACVLVRQSTVLLARCSVLGGFGTPSVDATSSVLQLSECREFAPGLGATTTNTIFGSGVSNVVPAGPAVRVTDGALVADECTITGARGICAGLTAHGGGPGLGGVRSELRVAGPQGVEGGIGASECSIFSPGGAGGDGVVHDATLLLDRATLRGGAGGTGASPGPPGVAVVGPAVTSVRTASLRAGPAVAPGGRLSFTAGAAPGLFVCWLLHTETLPQDIPGLRGRLVPRLDGNLLVLGPRVVGAAGADVLDVPIPNDPGLRGLVVFAQVASVDVAAFPLVFLSAAVPGLVGF